MQKISRPGLVFPKYIELTHFTLSICRRTTKKCTKIQNARVEHSHSHLLLLIYCFVWWRSRSLMFNFRCVFAYVSLEFSQDDYRSSVLHQMIFFHSFVINIIHRNLCSACLNHLLKTQGLGNNEEVLLSLFGVRCAMMKTKRKKGY